MPKQQNPVTGPVADQIDEVMRVATLPAADMLTALDAMFGGTAESRAEQRRVWDKQAAAETALRAQHKFPTKGEFGMPEILDNPLLEGDYVDNKDDVLRFFLGSNDPTATVEAVIELVGLPTVQSDFDWLGRNIGIVPDHRLSAQQHADLDRHYDAIRAALASTRGRIVGDDKKAAATTSGDSLTGLDLMFAFEQASSRFFVRVEATAEGYRALNELPCVARMHFDQYPSGVREEREARDRAASDARFDAMMARSRSGNDTGCG